MSRRIVFAGGSQTRALARIFRGEIAGQTGDDVVFIGTGAVGTEAARSTLLLADVLVMEVDEDGDAVPAAELPSRAEIVRVPNLYADQFWPFAGSAHPRNRGAFALPGGPFPAEHGDRFLDKMVAEGVGEAAAIKRYLAVNMVVEGELDDRLRDRLAIQQRLDKTAGYDLAGYIADNFRTEKLFNTRQRITMPLLRRVVAQLFEKLAVRGWQPESLKRVPFPAGAQPVHPAVIKHFGLTWAQPGERYPLNEEGFFTFEEFCGRYMRFEWNEALHRGIQTAKTRPAEALADLEAGLAISPDSPLGQLAFKVARRAAGLSNDAAGPDEVIDEDSYAPDAAVPVPVPAPEAAAPAAAAPVPPEPVAEPEPVAAETAPPAAVVPESEPELVLEPLEPPAPEPAPVEAVGSDEDLLEAAAPVEAPIEAEAPPVVVRPPPAEPMAPAEPAAETPVPTRADAPDADALTPSRYPKPGKPASDTAAGGAPPVGTTGFTDFGPKSTPKAAEDTDVLARPGEDLIEVLPRLLPVFRDLSSAVDRPFDSMPEVMPPPPLRPILPPELQGDAPKQGFLDRILGRKPTQ
jgi:hypothetical protein